MAKRVNADLVSPWGIALSPSGQWWIANKNGGVILALGETASANSVRGSFSVTVPVPPGDFGLPASPTGIVFNDSADFAIAEGRPARIIAVTEEGILSGWNPDVDKNNAIIAADKSATAVYKGVTIGRFGGKRRLYAANFFGGTIDVFDTYFHQVQMPANAFYDPGLPNGYVPYNVQEIGGRIYVAYALQAGNQDDAMRGTGYGLVSIFDSNGKLIGRLKSGSELNAPWGIAMAPPGFGTYANMLLIGNSGDGTIAVYDPDSGEFKGLLKAMNGYLITLQGLHGLYSESKSPGRKVYFCAGIEEQEHGLFGVLKPAPSSEKKTSDHRNKNMPKEGKRTETRGIGTYTQGSVL